MNVYEVNPVGSLELILLFILGFPGNIQASGKPHRLSPPLRENDTSSDISVVTDVDEYDWLHTLEFRRVIAPQNITVRILTFEAEGRR